MRLRRAAREDVRDGHGPLAGVLVVVEHFEVVEMRVAVELRAQSALVALHDAREVAAPLL